MHLAKDQHTCRYAFAKVSLQYDVPTNMEDKFWSWSSSKASWSLCHVSCESQVSRVHYRLGHICSVPDASVWEIMKSMTNVSTRTSLNRGVTDLLEF